MMMMVENTLNQAVTVRPHVLIVGLIKAKVTIRSKATDCARGGRQVDLDLMRLCDSIDSIELDSQTPKAVQFKSTIRPRSLSLSLLMFTCVDRRSDKRHVELAVIRKRKKSIRLTWSPTWECNRLEATIELFGSSLFFRFSVPPLFWQTDSDRRLEYEYWLVMLSDWVQPLRCSKVGGPLIDNERWSDRAAHMIRTRELCHCDRWTTTTSSFRHRLAVVRAVRQSQRKTHLFLASAHVSMAMMMVVVHQCRNTHHFDRRRRFRIFKTCNALSDAPRLRPSPNQLGSWFSSLR